MKQLCKVQPGCNIHNNKILNRIEKKKRERRALLKKETFTKSVLKLLPIIKKKYDLKNFLLNHFIQEV